MFGMDMMIKEMLGISPDELKVQVSQAMQQAQGKIESYDSQLRIISHRQVRIEKMLEKLLAIQGEDLPPTIEDMQNGSGNLTQQ